MLKKLCNLVEWFKKYCVAKFKNQKVNKLFNLLIILDLLNEIRFSNVRKVAGSTV